MSTSNKQYPKDFATFCHTIMADTLDVDDSDLFYHGTVTITREQLAQFTRQACREVLSDIVLQKSLF